MLGIPSDERGWRAESLAQKINRVAGVKEAKVEEEFAYVGGGSLPDQKLETLVVAVETGELPIGDLANRLRLGSPAVVGRIQEGRLILDLRTIFPNQEENLVRAIETALAAS